MGIKNMTLLIRLKNTSSIPIMPGVVKREKGTDISGLIGPLFYLKRYPGKKVSYHYLFQKVSRDFGHPLLEHPTLKELEKVSISEAVWVYSRDCINRPHSAAVIIINGKKPGDKGSIATFWVLLGEPVTSIAVPVWVEAKESPLPLYEGETAPICREAFRIKKIVRPYSERDKKNYMEVTRLVNKEKKGFLPLLLQTEKEIFEETAQFLKTKRSAGELAAFQNKMAQKALKTLKKVKN